MKPSRRLESSSRRWRPSADPKKGTEWIDLPKLDLTKRCADGEKKFREKLADKLQALALGAGSWVKLWMIDEARFGLHTEVRRLWALRGRRPVVTRQIKYQWDYLYGSLDILGGAAHFCHIPNVNQSWDRIYLRNLVAASDTEAIHVVIRNHAGFHLKDGDSRLPDRVRIIDLPPYSPELNPCEQLWDIVKDDVGNRVFSSISELPSLILPFLARYWNDPLSVLSLLGRDWLPFQPNSSPK